MAMSAWLAPVAARPVHAEVRLPGSKSMMARALVLAALASGRSTIISPLRSRDSDLMLAGLAAMGTHIDSRPDRTWTVDPARLAGPTRIDVGLSGTVMRFVPPVAALADGPVAFDGDPRARERPLGPLVRGLRAIGAHIDAADTADGGGLPLTVHGDGHVTGGEVRIDASASSQFVSGLMLAGA